MGAAGTDLSASSSARSVDPAASGEGLGASPPRAGGVGPCARTPGAAVLSTQVPTIGAVIRFRDSARTLPRVLASLERQSLRPDRLVGVDTGSRDGSAEILRKAGARIVPWTGPYHHSRTLN